MYPYSTTQINTEGGARQLPMERPLSVVCMSGGVCVRAAVGVGAFLCGNWVSPSAFLCAGRAQSLPLVKRLRRPSPHILPPLSLSLLPYKLLPIQILSQYTQSAPRLKVSTCFLLRIAATFHVTRIATRVLQQLNFFRPRNAIFFASRSTAFWSREQLKSFCRDRASWFAPLASTHPTFILHHLHDRKVNN